MKAIIDQAVKENIELREIKTPTDGRTSERRWLKERVKEVIDFRLSDYGIYSFVRIKDIDFLQKTWVN